MSSRRAPHGTLHSSWHLLFPSSGTPGEGRVGAGTRVPHRAARVVAAFVFFLNGCQDQLGTGGTGERVVPAAVLHRIDSLDLRPSQATTAPASQPATQPVPEVSLGIEECRRLALQNNLDLKVELFNPTISRTALTEAEAQFEAVFLGNLNASTARSPLTSKIIAPRTDAITPDAGVSIPLRTGGSIRLDMPVDVVHSHASAPPPKTTWNTDPSVTISQPLLRGAGLYVNSQGIRIAYYQFQRAKAMTKLVVTRVLSDTDRAYWRLFAAREELKVRKTEYDSALAQLQRARRQVRAGVGKEVDVIRADSGVADTVESVILAENDVRQRQRDLKRILNDPTLPLDGDTVITLSTDPAVFPYNLDAQALTSAALRQRMEMLQLELQIDEDTATVRVARNGLLPLVSLQYRYGVTGLGNTAGESFTMAWRRRPDSQTLGLQLEVPIGNEAARSQLRRALLDRMQALASREQLALQIRQEIADAVDTLRTDWERIVAARQRVVLNARTYDAEVRQFNLGLRTSTDVLIAQTDLEDARLAEVSAVSDYQIAQVDLAFATGTILGAAHVDWQPVPTPPTPRY